MNFKKLGFTGIATLLLLTACTGTFESPDPVLLVTGYQAAAGPRVALIRDNLTLSLERLAFLPASVRPLPAPSVDYDVVDRERARGSLVVLSRSLTNGVTGAPGYLTTFSLTGIDPANPVAFAQQGDVQTISDFIPVPTSLQNQTLIFCPNRLQVTQGGDYAAVLNVPSLCGLPLPPFIDILDLQGERLLARLGGVSGGGLYLSQNVVQDLLYYATPEAGSLQLQRATLPQPGQLFGPDDIVDSVPVVAVPVPAGQNDAVDLGRAGAATEERLVFLFRNSLRNVLGFGVGGTAQVGPLVDTAGDNASVIPNDARSTEATFVLSVPRAGVVTYVPPPSESDTFDQESARVVAVNAVIQATRNFIYFVANQQVALFDLSAYDMGDPLPDPIPITVSQLTAPSFITWAQSAPQAATP